MPPDIVTAITPRVWMSSNRWTFVPYGCSKGSGGFFMLPHLWLADGSLPDRLCFGTRQFGIEDQAGWRGLCIASVLGRPISSYWNGKQSVTCSSWKISWMLTTQRLLKRTKLLGSRFNIGGQSNIRSGKMNLPPILERLLGHPIQEWNSRRRSKSIISDIRKAKKVLGWEPKRRCRGRHSQVI